MKMNLANYALHVETIIDVGVLYGTPWLYDSFPQASLVLVDPLPEVESVRLQYSDRDVAAFQVAAGEEVGSARLQVVRKADGKIAGHTGIVDRSRLTRKAVAAHVDVPVMPLDDIVDSQTFHAPFGLKIDAEGYELPILKGAHKTLARTEFLILEISTKRRFDSDCRSSAIFALLGEAGFELFEVLGGNGPTMNYYDMLFVRYTNSIFDKSFTQNGAVRIDKNSINHKAAQQRIHKLEREMARNVKQLQQTKAQLAHIYSSNSWRITRPVRLIASATRVIAQRSRESILRIARRASSTMAPAAATKGELSTPPSRVNGSRFGVVVTTNETPAQTRGFINFHLNVGAEHIVVCFDNPSDPVMSEYLNHPDVSCICCTTKHWLMLLGRQPDNMQEKQHANLRYGSDMLRRRGIDWIISLDTDELLFPSKSSVQDVLDHCSNEVDFLQVQPKESIQHDGMHHSSPFAARYFKVLPDPRDASPPAEQDCILSTLSELTRNGFFGHTIGKSFFRASSAIDTYNQHIPKSSNCELVGAQTDSLSILHFDCMSFQGWRRKWQRRVDGTTRATAIHDKRRLQTEEIRTALSKGNDAFYELFRRWHYWPMDRITEALSAGILEFVDIEDSMFELPQSGRSKSTDWKVQQ